MKKNTGVPTEIMLIDYVGISLGIGILITFGILIGRDLWPKNNDAEINFTYAICLKAGVQDCREIHDEYFTNDVLSEKLYADPAPPPSYHWEKVCVDSRIIRCEYHPYGAWCVLADGREIATSSIENYCTKYEQKLTPIR